jgi:threonine/homoserine/homoserine lactone efflux protein
VSAALGALALGALLGFLLSVPAAGPLLALVALTAARGGLRRAAALALGGALAESGWALAVLLGLGWLLEIATAHTTALSIASAGVLAALAAVILVRARRPALSPLPVERATGHALVGFSLVALNPGFPLAWAAVAAALYSSGVVAGGVASSLSLAIGVFAGIVVWFSLVIAIARRFGATMSDRAGRRLALLVALGLLASSIWLLRSALSG